MEKIIINTKTFPNKTIFNIIFNDIYIYIDDLYYLNKYNIDKLNYNIMLLKNKDYDGIERYYKVDKFFVNFFTNLLKKTNYNIINIAIFDNGIIPRNKKTDDIFKESLCIKCKKQYQYKIYICFYNNIIYVSSNNLNNIKKISSIIKPYNFNLISYKKYENIEIIYKKII